MTRTFLKDDYETGTMNKKTKHKKILLLIDNFSGHMLVTNLKRIKFVCIPPNVTVRDATLNISEAWWEKVS